MWNPYKTDHIHSLEMVQRRAARFVTNIFHNTSTVPDMLDHLQWETLECKRCKLQLTMFYEIVNNIAEIDKDLYLILAMARKERAIKEVHADLHPPRLLQIQLFPRYIPLWNKLPASTAGAYDLVLFKQGLSNLEF